MTDKIKKNLAKFSAKERRQVKNITLALTANQTKGLNIIKLKGTEDIYRVRKGNIRIIFTYEDNEVILLSISKRDEKTYKGL